MYNNKGSDEKVKGKEEGFDVCNMEKGQKYIAKWSPQEEVRYFSKNRYGSPRMLSKSVPRSNKRLVRYKISRSLNFDAATPKSDSTFKSPNSNSGSSSFDGDRYLTRSAKIMRSLNINYSPFSIRKKKISKTLNFDLSPSPKRLGSGRSLNLSSNTSPGFNKALNVDNSPNDSNVSSILGSSIDSIDENQNQTPSHRNRKVKKSLTYLTPNSRINLKSPNFGRNSSAFRNELVSNIVQISMTPNLHSLKRSKKMFKIMDEIAISTPRNLFQEFHDEENERPQTPENVIQLIPESMSAIKKSHKKERLSRRLEKLITHQVGESSEREHTFTDKPILLSQSEERPLTPQANASYSSPNYDVSSIKQSHKKDKSRKKMFPYHSEDEISDSGSIFDYRSEERENVSTAKSNTWNDSEKSTSPLGPTRRDCEKNEERVLDVYTTENTNLAYSENAEGRRNTSSCPESPELVGTSSKFENSSFCNVEEGSDTSSLNSLPTTPSSGNRTSDRRVTLVINEEPSGNASRPVTPENHVNFLQRIMTDSIKKSHKKIKDKKKKIYKPRVLECETNLCTESQASSCPSIKIVDDSLCHNDEIEEETSEECDCPSLEDLNRASTPENINSSRMLLPQFSSVKKSHRKDKHNNIVLQFAIRQKYFNRNGERSFDSRYDSKDPGSDVDSASARKDKCAPNELPIDKSGHNDNKQYRLEKLSNNDDSFKSPVDTPPSNRSSPNKRKKSLNESIISNASLDSLNAESSSVDYESAEEEFKIFTPIKKRKSLLTVVPSAECSTTCNPTSKNVSYSAQVSEIVDIYRCVTPTTSQKDSFETAQTHISASSNGDSISIARDENSSPLEEQRTVADNSNGRSTPSNRSTTELLSNIASIKKSHRKDKRNKRLRKSLISGESRYDQKMESSEPMYDFKAPINYLTPNSKNSSLKCEKNDEQSFRNESTDVDSKYLQIIDFENPQPSTSYENVTIASARSNCRNETDSVAVKTPPNCLKAKSYLKLLQTDSIKRSHKRERDRKRQSLLIQDPELSDDGSIFGEEDRIGATEIDATKEKGNDGNDRVSGDIDIVERETVETPPGSVRSDLKADLAKNSEEKVEEFSHINLYRNSADLSNEKSICNLDENLKNVLGDLNGKARIN